MSLSCASCRASACRPLAASRRNVSVTAIFGGRDAAAEGEAKKQKQMEAQQAILEERRAKRDAFLRGEGTVKGGRVGPRSRSRSMQDFEPAPPPPPKSMKQRAQQVAYEEEEEDEEPAAKSNPLAGLLGGLFGKK